jgi:hypothetical protein
MQRIGQAMFRTRTGTSESGISDAPLRRWVSRRAQPILRAAFACDAGGEGSGEGEMRERTVLKKRIYRARNFALSRISYLASVFVVIYSIAAISSTSSCADHFGLSLSPAYRTWTDTFINGPNYQSTYVYWLNDEAVVLEGYLEQATSKNFRTLPRSLFTGN